MSAGRERGRWWLAALLGGGVLLVQAVALVLLGAGQRALARRRGAALRPEDVAAQGVVGGVAARIGLDLRTAQGVVGLGDVRLQRRPGASEKVLPLRATPGTLVCCQPSRREGVD
ncbi:hypothetical protein GCM10022279_33400 [Comamonas faecalis]|uniref:Uncharacterized protein n=1 Tax=Comamonas faecalis TaxID=1387849 RepID=A0ABP7S5Q7_9BURK